MKRESFRSRLGFLLVSAGCAIGIGNVWRFPYIAGKNGGGYFVLFYLLCLLVMGVPVLTMELAVGRASRRSAVLSYKTLEKPGQKWHIHGWFCLLGCYLLMMYYTTVSGWMVSYFGKFLTGAFHSGMSTDEVASAFGAMLSSPGEMALWAEVVVVAGFLVCSFGLQKGLERVTKVMMLCLLVLIQSADMNRWFFNDYVRSEKEGYVVHTLATKLQSGYDLSKPVIFTNCPDHWQKDGGYLMTHLYPGADVNGNSVIYWCGNTVTDYCPTFISDLFRLYGYDFLVSPTVELAQAAQEAAEGMPIWPQNGCIREFDDFIAVNFG